jgi:uncharacterized phage infection (PIP) family protein YhgE
MSKHARVTVSPARNASLPQRWVWLGAGGTAIGFGVLTVLAGWSVLVGVRDPGHAVLQPLLIFNSVMGLLYLATGRQIMSRRDSARWSAGIGLLISTVSSTQQEAFMATFLIFMPAILLSGFMFPVSSMPEVFQWLTNLNPVRHFLVIVRSIFLKGVGPAVLWPQYLALAGIGGSLLWFAAHRFKAVHG